MELRPELCPPRFDERLVERLTWLADHLDGSLDETQNARLVEEFNSKANTQLDWFDFQEIYGAMNHSEWVKEVLSRLHQKLVPDISRAELIEIVRRIVVGEGTESDIHFYVGLLQANLPSVQVSDLIFYPKLFFNDKRSAQREMTPEEIVDAALLAQANAPKPIELPPSSLF